MPDEIKIKFNKLYEEHQETINGRVCKITVYDMMRGGKYAYTVCPIDDGIPTTKTAQKAAEAQVNISAWLLPVCYVRNGQPHFEFVPKLYKNEGVAKSAMKWHDGRGKLFNPVEIKVPCPTKCEDCEKRFKCMTEK
jgi:hypothetical protein